MQPDRTFVHPLQDDYKILFMLGKDQPEVAEMRFVYSTRTTLDQIIVWYKIGEEDKSRNVYRLVGAFCACNKIHFDYREKDRVAKIPGEVPTILAPPASPVPSSMPKYIEERIYESED